MVERNYESQGSIQPKIYSIMLMISLVLISYLNLNQTNPAAVSLKPQQLINTCKNDNY